MDHTFPPPGYVSVDSAIDGIEVYMPTPETPEDHKPVVEFSCPQCGAGTAYSAEDGGLTCAHCGYYEAPEKEIVGKRASEFEFTVATLERAAQGWGEIRKEMACQQCGARTTLSPETLSHTCVFCGSNKVLQSQAAQDVLRPRFLVPFVIEAGACQEVARKWLGSSWMTP